MIKNLRIINLISSTICGVFNLAHIQNVVNSIICGSLEITRGIIELSLTNIHIQTKTIIASSLVAFGGFSIFFQSAHFLDKLKIKKHIILKQKLTQAIICYIVSLPLCLLFL